jgi:acyl dehydratase
MTEKTIVTIDELPSLVGTRLGPSEWLVISQERIDTFANATGDHQWIHVDPDRAKDGPFGATIAHGFLTLSLLIPMWTELFDVDGVSNKINYGLDKVRFLTPVTADSRVRLSFSFTEITEIETGAQLKIAATIELEGSERPAVAVEFIARFLT